MKGSIHPTLFIMVAIVLSACTQVTMQPNTAVTDVSTPTLQVLESSPTQASTSDQMERFSSDQLGLCFSYPQGFTQVPNIDTVEVIAPSLEGTGTRGLFWLEISNAYDRTAEKIADHDMAGNEVSRWNLTLDGEQAVVLDGMPGQDLQRRVYVVHQQTLYVLGFMPTRSNIKEVGDQMEALFTAITNSWAWSPCPVSK